MSSNKQRGINSMTENNYGCLLSLTKALPPNDRITRPRVAIVLFKHYHIDSAGAVTTGYPLLNGCPDATGSQELSALLIQKN